jgi:hypothetical protein
LLLTLSTPLLLLVEHWLGDSLTLKASPRFLLLLIAMGTIQIRLLRKS